MSNYLYKDKPIENYLVDANGASGTADYKITHMRASNTSVSLSSLNYEGALNNISFLKVPSDDFEFIESEELKNGYSATGFVDRTKTPFLPLDSINGSPVVALRFGEYFYNSMVQLYKTSSNSSSNADLFTLSLTKNGDNTLVLQTDKSGNTVEIRSQIIYLLLQAGGGDGGKGAQFGTNANFASNWSAAAGGAGGSGAAALISVNMNTLLQKNLTLYIKGLGRTLSVTTEDKLDIQSIIQNNKDAILVGGGYGGVAGSASKGSASEGKGGSGGTVTIQGIFDTENNNTLKGSIRIISTSGTTGADGKSVVGRGDDKQVVSGATTREESFKVYNNHSLTVYPYTTSGTLLRLADNLSKGFGEPKDPNLDNSILAAGPGGAPSPLCPGKSHPYNGNANYVNPPTIYPNREIDWPGSGGVGQSGWPGVEESALEDCNKGGPPAVWLFYLPTLQLSFSLRTDNTYEVTVKDNTAIPEYVDIPSTYQNTAVTSIGNSAFSDCTNLSSIVIPDSITYIGEDAFSNCSNLTSATIGRKYWETCTTDYISEGSADEYHYFDFTNYSVKEVAEALTDYSTWTSWSAITEEEYNEKS